MILSYLQIKFGLSEKNNTSEDWLTSFPCFKQIFYVNLRLYLVQVYLFLM